MAAPARTRRSTSEPLPKPRIQRVRESAWVAAVVWMCRSRRSSSSTASRLVRNRSITSLPLFMVARTAGDLAPCSLLTSNVVAKASSLAAARRSNSSRRACCAELSAVKRRNSAWACCADSTADWYACRYCPSPLSRYPRWDVSAPSRDDRPESAALNTRYECSTQCSASTVLLKPVHTKDAKTPNATAPAAIMAIRLNSGGSIGSATFRRNMPPGGSRRLMATPVKANSPSPSRS